MAGEGAAELEILRQGGFSEADIDARRQEGVRLMQDGGYNDQQIKDYFGLQDPDMSETERVIQENFKKRDEQQRQATEATQERSEETPDEAQSNPDKPLEIKEAETFLETLEAGFDMSVTGLLRDKPDVFLKPDADRWQRIASGIATIAGDIPFMVAGSAAGATAGAAASVAVTGPGAVATAPVGATIGAGAGAFALPEAMREALIRQYEDGAIDNFGEFWDRAASVFIAGAKGAVIGAATAGTGAAVGKLLHGSKALVKSSAQIASEVTTMTAVGSALEGEVPDVDDFIDAAVVIGAFKGTVASGKFIQQRLMKIYAETGMPPGEVAERAEIDPVLRRNIFEVENPKQKVIEGIEGNPRRPKPEKPEPTSKEAIQKESTNLKDGRDGLPLTESKSESIISEVLPPPKNVAEAFARMDQKIVSPKTAKKEGYTYRDFYKDFIDRLNPITEAVRDLGHNPELLRALDNPMKLARLVTGSKAKARYFMEKGGGALDFKTGEKVFKPLSDIVEPFSTNLKDFVRYAMSKRAIELEKRNINSGFILEDAKLVVNLGKAKFDKAQKELVEFQNHLVKYLLDAEIIDKRTFTEITKNNKDYVPYKVIEEGGKLKGGKTKITVRTRIKGSDLAKQNPLLSIATNIELFTRMAETNRAKKALIDLAGDKLESIGIVEVKTGLKPVKINSKEIQNAMAKQGFELDAEGFTVFRGTKRPLAKNEFEVFIKGKRKVFKTLDPSLAEAINTIGADLPAAHMLIRVAGGFSTALRIGVTAVPEFIATNLFRDQIQSAAFSRSKTRVPFLDIASAMGDIFTKNEVYFNWLKSQGPNSAFFDMNSRYLEQNIFKLNTEVKFLDKVQNYVSKPIDVLKVASDLAENGTRLAEFKRDTRGKTDLNSLFEGGFASKEITLDFQRMGAKISAFNTAIPFLNANIQGLDKLVRAIKNNPGQVAIRSAAFITVPSILLWWANHDVKDGKLVANPRYDNLPNWQKDNYWIILTDDWQDADEQEASGFPDDMVREGPKGKQVNKGIPYRLRKPLELGILFGSIPERLLTGFMTENPDAFKDLSKTIGGLITPPFIPTIGAPALEHGTNRNFFAGRQLVPDYLEDFVPADRFTLYTSETAKQLAKLIGTLPNVSKIGPKDAPLGSPIVIDNYIRGWGGTLGQYAVSLLDKVLIKSGVVEDPEKPADTLSDLPIVKAFVVRYPSLNAQPIVDFHNNYQSSLEVSNSVRARAKENDIEGVEELLGIRIQGEFEAELEQGLANAQPEKSKVVKLDGVKEALRIMSKGARRIHKSKGVFDATEKRQLIDTIYFQMIEIAKEGNQLLIEIQEDLQREQQDIK